MKEIARRITSLLLSFIIVLGVMPMNLLAGTSLSVNGNNSTSTIIGGNGSRLSYKTLNFNATGYKVQLVFLKLSDDIYYNENTVERKKAITDAWNKLERADLKTSLDSGEETGLHYIGDPVYLTSQKIYNDPLNKVTYGYKFSDFHYGIGDKSGTDNTGLVRGLTIVEYIKWILLCQYI